MTLNPLALHASLLDVIKHKASNAARSLQTELGPSEIGDPCERKLAYKLHGVPPVNADRPNYTKPGDKWRATVGTAVHSWLEETFGDHPDFLTERKVVVGAWFDGTRARVLQGSCDLYYLPAAAVLDWKTTSQAKMQDYARGKIPEVYRVQAHAYGLGYKNAGYDVQHVGLVFLPRDDELNLSTSVLHLEPFDQTVAEEGMARLERIAQSSQHGDFASLATASSFCTNCQWFSSGSKKPDEGRCPGVFTQRTLDPADPFA